VEIPDAVALAGKNGADTNGLFHYITHGLAEGIREVTRRPGKSSQGAAVNGANGPGNGYVI